MRVEDGVAFAVLNNLGLRLDDVRESRQESHFRVILPPVPREPAWQATLSVSGSSTRIRGV